MRNEDSLWHKLKYSPSEENYVEYRSKELFKHKKLSAHATRSFPC